MSDTEEDSKDKSKRPLEVSSEGNDEVEEKRSSRKRGKNLNIFRPYFAFQVHMFYAVNNHLSNLCVISNKA